MEILIIIYEKCNNQFADKWVLTDVKQLIGHLGVML